MWGVGPSHSDLLLRRLADFGAAAERAFQDRAARAARGRSLREKGDGEEEEEGRMMRRKEDREEEEEGVEDEEEQIRLD